MLHLIGGTYMSEKTNKPINTKAKNISIIVLVITIVVIVGISFFTNRNHDVNFTKGVNVTVKGFDGYGSVEVNRTKNDLGFYEYTKDQNKAIQKYNERILIIKELLPLYYSQLYTLKEENSNYDPDVLTNMVLYDNKDLKVMQVNDIESLADAFEIVKQAALYGNQYGDISLYSCELIMPDSKVNGQLSNGDQVIYRCQTSAYAKDILNINSDHQLSITVENLGQGNVINLDEVIQADYTIELAGYDGYQLTPSISINDALLPAGIALGNDITITTDTSNNTFAIEASTSREDILFTSSLGSCINESACSYTLEIDKPQINEFTYFDNPNSYQNYELVSNTVKEVADNYFDAIDWKVADAKGNEFTVSNYELTRYDSGNQFGRNLDFTVYLDNGNTCRLRLFGIVISNDGKAQFITNQDQTISGEIYADGLLH